MSKNTTTSSEPAEETKEEPEVAVALAHCGEFAVKEKQVSGWFHPIKMNLWMKILGFHREISKRHNAESVSYHRWNPRKNEYDTIIPFQDSTGKGLAVDVKWDDPRNRKLLDEYAAENGQEFFPCCTIHTHVDAAAFESGTDAGDEEDLPGWHITIGHLLTKKKIDLDCRFRLPKLPKVSELTDVEDSFDLDEKHLFEKGVNLDIVTNPESTTKNWFNFLSRVHIR